MDLMPKVSRDFSSKKYWDRFFTKRKDAFEWYGNYFELCGLLYKYITKRDQVLVSGCGNSKLSQQIYDGGITNIVNIDISHTVIQQMASVNKDRSAMEWLEMDINKMTFPDSYFSVVLDKGTLDAMMSSDEGSANIDRMFDEIHRVLKICGRYLVITLAQDHVLQKLLDYFPSNNWMLRVHKVLIDSDDDGDSPRLPVFMFVFTKMASAMKQKIIEISFDETSKNKRLQSESDAKELIKSQQYFAMYKSKLNRKEEAENQVIELFNPSDHLSARYRINVVDIGKKDKPFGIFIVGHGMEYDWLYATNEGRQQLAESAGYSRLLVVSLNRHHTYEVSNNDGGWQCIKDELSSKVMELAPAGLPRQHKTPFMCSGGNLGERHVRAVPKDDQSGWLIEEYMSNTGIPQQWYRRIISENKEKSPSNLLASVMSELALNTAGNKNKKNRKRGSKANKSQAENDMQIRSVDCKKVHTKQAQISVFLLSQAIADAEDTANLLFIGLSSHVALITNLQYHFPKVKLNLFEEDQELIEKCKEWCALDTAKMEIHHKNEKENGTTYDAILREIELDEQYNPILPHNNFDEYIIKLKSMLSPKGVLILKMVAPKEHGGQPTEDEMRDSYRVLKETFATIHTNWDSDSLRLTLVCHVTKREESRPLVDKRLMTSLTGSVSMTCDKFLDCCVPL